VQFNAYIRSAATGVKGYSFLRFYNDVNTLLLEYKSQAITSTSYQSTGNYTETPPDTKYMTIGIDRDSSGKGWVYADEFSVETNIGTPVTKHKPTCDLDQYMHPFWKSDTIYNETVLLYSAARRPATGKLLYMPQKILSVKSFDLDTTYGKGIDYTVNGDTILRTIDSHMPFRTDSSFDKKDMAWYGLQSQWVVVTYIHKDSFPGPVPVYKGARLPNTMAKLHAKSPLTIAAFGMSITRGMNVSDYDTVKPYMPAYVDLFAYGLRKAFGDYDITLYNAGLPGSVTDWGALYADKYINPLQPDLVILDFGMNDFWKYTPQQFNGYIRTMINKIRAGNPNVEFLLLSNMLFEPDYIADTNSNKAWYIANMKGYNSVLQQIEKETTGSVNLDMTTLSDILYHRKKAKDCLANPLHPNDYLARWYAQGMTALFDER
jgi:lysophospholipase L1-like esterase